jgi:hypothetical protein
MRQKAGRITAAGMMKEVTFEPTDGTINDPIDDAYRAKYRGSPYLAPLIGASARSATVKVMPRLQNQKKRGIRKSGNQKILAREASGSINHRRFYGNCSKTVSFILTMNN